MRELEALIESMEAVRDAVLEKDREQAMALITGFLLQFIGVYGHNMQFVARLLPTLEQLKHHIQDEAFDDAYTHVLAFLVLLRQARGAGDKDDAS